MTLLKRPRWLTSHPKARKDRACDSRWACPGIFKGQKYRRAVLPPRVEPNSNAHWYATATCGACERREERKGA